MDPIRVLIVDDSAPIRRLLEEALGSDPGISIVGTAPNGELALLAMRTERPDAIILDLEMPVMNGIEFLRELRAHAPRLPVIVFSSLSSHGAEVTLEAMWLGANDYVTKPRATNVAAARQQAASDLIPRIKAFVEAERMRAAKKRGTQAGSDPSRAAAAPLVRPKDVASALDAVLRSPASFAESARPPAAKRVVRPARSRIVAIAASTGGPRALAEILRQLPANLDVPILIAQHMPPMFTGYLANGLSIQCGLKVSEAYPGARLRPGQVWIAPGDHHMVLRAEGASLEIAINQNAHENACRPSADPLFRSVAEFYEREALAIVLTGMGQDGLLGAREIRERGGRVVVQDEASSVIWGMPGSIARAGIADAVLSLDAIALEILHRAHAPGGRRAA